MSAAPAATADPAVLINGISKRFGAVAALSQVSLSVPRGGFFGLLGPNGAGKTTLIGILGGLARPDSGEGFVHGKDIVANTLEVRRLIGIVPQEPVYDPFFKVREALVFQSKYYGISDNGGWLDTLLQKLQLQDKLHTNTRALSGGMKRRLMIAQALVHKPPVIVLDEPTAGVDINLRLSLWQFIRDLNREGHTIILTTHYLEEADALCDSVALMNRGKVAACGRTRDLLAASHHAASVRLRLHPPAADAAPPPTPHATDDNGARIFHLDDCDKLEPLLAAHRQAGHRIAEIAVSPPKLEDVFVQLMHDNDS